MVNLSSTQICQLPLVCGINGSLNRLSARTSLIFLRTLKAITLRN
jgi:hypothetical protein